MKLSTLTLALATGAAPLFAAESLETIVVTATGYPTAIDDALASMEIITAEEIQRSIATDIGDLLKFHTGLEIGRNGGPGQATSLFIRGTESDHNLVMIDGIPVNSGSVSSTALQHIDPQNIERIEIYKGPRSTLWGSGAIGGVINIITRKATGDTLGYGGHLEGGSDNTWRGNARLSHTADNHRLSAAISYQKTDGFPPLSSSNIDRGYENTSFDLAAGMDAGIHHFNASHWQSQGNNEYLDFFGAPLDQDFLNSRSSLGWEVAFSEQWSSTLELAHVLDHIDQNQSNGSVHTDRTELAWRNKLSISNLDQVLLGIKTSNEDVTAKGGFSPYDADTDFIEAWGQYDLTRGSHHAIAGIRYLDHDDAGEHFTWSLNYGYYFGQNTRAWASAATAFRVPSANERFGFGGNPDLEPEESTSYELGLKHRISGGHKLSAALYRNDIDNMIQWVLVTPPWVGYNQNVAEVRIDGLELGYDFSGDALSLHLGGNWQNPEDRSSGDRLLRRAEHSFNARINYIQGNWSFGGDLLYSGERKDFGGVTLDSYTLVNLNVSYQLNRNWQIFAKLENAFDEDYQLAYGYNTQGRAGFLGIRFSQ
ncbi:TonB-dependent receptor domain-containing protein [Thiolapillus sp.]